MKKTLLYLLLAFATIANAQIVPPEKGTLQFVRNSEVRSTGAMIDSIPRNFILASSYLDTATFVRKNLMTDENGVKDFIAETKTHYTIVDVPNLPIIENVYGELLGFDCSSITNINNNNLLLKNGSMEGYIMLPNNSDFGELHLYFDSTSTDNTLYVIAPVGDKIRHRSSVTGLIENFPLLEIAQQHCYSIHFKRVGDTWYVVKESQGTYVYNDDIINVNVNKLVAANSTQGQVLAYQTSLNQFVPTTIAAAPTMVVKTANQIVAGAGASGHLISDLIIPCAANTKYHITGRILVSDNGNSKTRVFLETFNPTSNFNYLTSRIMAVQPSIPTIFDYSNKSMLNNYLGKSINIYEFPIAIEVDILLETNAISTLRFKLSDDGQVVTIHSGSFLKIQEY